MRSLYPVTPNKDLVEILNERHGHGRNVAAVRQRAIKLGIKKSEGHKHPMPKKLWTEERSAWMREFVPGHSEGEIIDAFEDRFGIRLTRCQVKNGKATCGVKSGTCGGRFEKGQESWNKGKSWGDFMPAESQERSRETCFKKGNMPHNAIDKPIGYERIDKDGYTWVKVADRPTRHDCNDNWRQKHHIEWEKANGKAVPENANIIFANHDKTDFRPENLVCVPRSIWSVIVRNRYEYHNAESLRSCMALAELKANIFAAEKYPRDCKKCGSRFAPRYANQRTCDVCLGRIA